MGTRSSKEKAGRKRSRPVEAKERKTATNAKGRGKGWGGQTERAQKEGREDGGAKGRRAAAKGEGQKIRRRFPLPASLSRERLLLTNSPPPSCPPLALPLPGRRFSPRAPPGPRAPFRRRRVLAPEQPAGRHPRRFLDETPGCVQTRGGSTADGPASPPGPVPARRPSAPVPKGDSRKRKPRKAARRRPPRKPARPCQRASTPRQRIFRAPLPLPPHVRLSLPPPMGPASARISPNGSPAGRSARRTASVANGPSGREAFPEAKRRLGARHAAGHEPDPRVAPAAFPPCGRRNRPGRRDARAGTAAPPGDRPGPGSPSDAAASLPPAQQIRPEALRLRPHGLRIRIPPRRQQPLRQQPQLLPLPPDPGRPPQMPHRPRQARLRRPEGAARGPEKGHQIRRQRLKPPRPQDLRRPRQKRRRLGRPEAAPPDPPPRGPIRQLLRPDGRRGRPHHPRPPGVDNCWRFYYHLFQP
jgi:hypothetical protein